MKHIIISILCAFCYLICHSAEKPQGYKNENDAAVSEVQRIQPQYKNDLIRIIGKADRHDGGGAHLGYNMLLYNERTNLYLPLVITVWPTERGVNCSTDLRSNPYRNPRYHTSVSIDSEWVEIQYIQKSRNPFNGDIEYHYNR